MSDTVKRRPLSDGGWFDVAKAYVASHERERWDGRNWVSEATGSEWDHQRLLRTARGSWVLHSWSQWQGSGETYQRLTAHEAAMWCASYGRTVPSELAEAVREQEA